MHSPARLDACFGYDGDYLNIHKRFESGVLIEWTINGVSQPLAGHPNIIANATGAAFRLAKATMKGEKVRASQSEIDRRMAICKTCEHFVDNPMKCRKCGCFLNLKTRLETEHCPIGKW